MSLLLLCLSALLVVGTLRVRAQRPSETKIREAVRRHMAQYPKSTLRDLYKSFFQDRFGPGHLLNDTTAASNYLKRELASKSKFDGPLYEATGAVGRFYRVNLSVIKDGWVDYPTFFRVFVQSAQNVKPMPIRAWKKEWAKILRTLEKMKLGLPNHEADRVFIDEMLRRDEYVMHHSQAFNEAYDLHYRIIDKTLFNKFLLPIIKQKQ